MFLSSYGHSPNSTVVVYRRTQVLHLSLSKLAYVELWVYIIARNHTHIQGNFDFIELIYTQVKTFPFFPYMQWNQSKPCVHTAVRWRWCRASYVAVITEWVCVNMLWFDFCRDLLMPLWILTVRDMITLAWIYLFIFNSVVCALQERGVIT